MYKTVIQEEIKDKTLQHLAPENSPEHRALRAAARKAGKNEDALRDLLWLINAHDRLLGLKQIALNLLEILTPILANASSLDDDLAVFRGWPEVLDWIAYTPGVAESADASRDGNPVLGFGMGRHPFYGCLWEGPDETRWIPRYRSLQWHLLWAHASYLYNESQCNPNFTRHKYETYGENEMWNAFPNSPDEAARTVRVLANPGWGLLLKELPLKRSPKQFAEKLDEVDCPKEVQEDLGSKANWIYRRDLLQSFIEKANGLSPWVKRVVGHGGVSTIYEERDLWSVDITPGDKDDPDACWPRGRWVTVSDKVNEKDLERFGDLDLDPMELAPPEYRYQSEQEAYVQDPRQLAVQSALAARGQCRHVQLAHQMLPWQYNQLTLQELAWLLNGISEELERFSDRQEWSEEQYSTAELVALIYVMLWTGSSLDRACKLELLAKAGTDQYREEQINEAELLFDIDKTQWSIHAASPQYRSDIKDTRKQAHQLATSLCLPDVAGTGSLLCQLFERRFRDRTLGEDGSQDSNNCEGGGLLFSGAVEDYRKRLEKWLRAPVINLTGRVTISRIASFLFNRLVAATGDVMVAVSITGHSHPLARTQQFYSTYAVSEMQKIYKDVASKLVLQVARAAEPEPGPTTSAVRAVDEDYVGARLCARKASIKEAIQMLHEQICEKSQSTDRAGSIAFHNLYTLHCVLLFGYATSMRAIWTPYLELNRVDEVTGFALISDKDDDAQHKSRLAWVPPFVREQMHSYKDHCFAVALNNSRTFSWPEPCFFLGDDEKPFDVRPKTLSAQMLPFLALPPNAHRRFMRHELLGAGCPPEVVNAWLGHAFQGEEPWGPHSSFSFADYRNNLVTYLLPVLEELGWKHLRSPLT